MKAKRQDFGLNESYLPHDSWRAKANQLTRNLVSSEIFPGTGWTLHSSIRTMLDPVSLTFPRESERRVVRNFLHVDVFTWSRISTSLTVAKVLDTKLSFGTYLTASENKPDKRISMLGLRDLVRRRPRSLCCGTLGLPDGEGRRDCQELTLPASVSSFSCSSMAAISASGSISSAS